MTTSVALPVGLVRFQKHLTAFQNVLNNVAVEKNPAYALHKQKARTPLFMLEALCRLYKKMHNKKKFSKLYDRFKLLEDLLGAIDFYDTYVEFAKANKKIPTSISAYFKKKLAEKCEELNMVLKTKGWMDGDALRMKKIVGKLNEADWKDEVGDRKAAIAAYLDEMAGIKKDIAENKINFDNVEEDVHELRRELRWLSIYAQAFDGLFQLKQSKQIKTSQKKYLTKNILTSPFNKMPAVGDLKNVIQLNAPNFYALSWLIDALGNLKDSGLNILAVTEAVMVTEKVDHTKAIAKAMQLLGTKQQSLKTILVEAKKISSHFFNEKVLDGLLVG